MKNYQVIARRFRPSTFKEVVGQEAIVTTIKNALKRNNIGAAYLFCGTRGTGKTTLARLLAKALNCERLSPECDPCNSCPSCLEMLSGQSLNLLEIDGASNRGIDDIRQINETVGYAPASGKYKVYLIDEVHMLTKEAFNALLKTLEEPPAHVKFFFATTEPHKVLATIISRCQRFDLHPIPPSLIQQKLRQIATTLNRQIEEEALQLIAEHADGALRDAESLLDQLLCYSEGTISTHQVTQALGLLPHALFLELDHAIHTHNLTKAFDLSDTIYQTTRDPSRFIEGFMHHIRLILESILTQKAHNSASLYTQEQCLYILDYLLHWHQEFTRTGFKRIGLEVVLLHLLRTRNYLSSDLLVKRLIALESSLHTPPPATSLLPADSPLPFTKPPKESPSVTPRAPLATIGEEKNAPNNPSPHADGAGNFAIASTDQKYETLLRFASVELEGSIKTEKK